ncbi:Cytochrome P450 67 [Trametes pubescens]|uniref:Cytochrome P450 67 n=1 Tax=Trametes pubescens TaxID=154538 RepID=A0A1M2VTX0_TRAPU|nr:Cytochrome P450 67 [Trametes pubescens]
MISLPVPNEYLGFAAAAGVASWLYLNRRTVRGDYAFLFYSAAYLALYAILRAFPLASATPSIEAASIALTYFTTLASVTVGYRLSPWHPLASYPGPVLWRISSVYLTYISFMGRRHLILDKLHAKYGPFLRIGPNTLSLNTPAATSVYLTMEKGEAYRFPAHDDVMGIFFKPKSKEVHRERKKLWGGMFTPNGLVQLTPALEKRTWELLRCIERRQKANGGYVNLPEAFSHWAHDFMELMKNGDAEELIYTGKLGTAMLDSLGQSPWVLDILWQIPTTKDMHQLVRLASQMTRTRVQAKELPAFRDLISYLMEGGVSLPEMERDAVIGIVGGFDNPSIAMALCCYFLVSEPHHYVKLRAELDAAFPEPLGHLAYNTLATLPLLNSTIHEVFRLGSPFFLPRVAGPGGAKIDGRYIPEGTIVALAAYSQQISPDNFYPEPMNFRPERWQPQGLGPDTKTNKAVLASFSFGPHSCPGKALAWQKLRYCLSRVVLAFDMEFQPGFDVQAFRDGILNVRTTLLEKDMFMKVSRRAGVDLDKAFATLESEI